MFIQDRESSPPCRIPAAVDIGRLHDYHPSNLLFPSHPSRLSFFCRKFLLRLFHIFRRPPCLSTSLRIVTPSLFRVFFFSFLFSSHRPFSPSVSLSLLPRSLSPQLSDSPSLFRLSAFLSSLSSLFLPPPPRLSPPLPPLSLSLQLHTSSLNNTHQREPPATTTTHWRHRQYGTPLY